MKIRWIWFCILLMSLCGFGISAHAARPILADLAIRTIEIDHNFNGIDILLFGAKNDSGDIVVVVRGPKHPFMVRKKERIAGFWTNTDSAGFIGVNQFYAVAATRPLEQIKNEQLLSELEVGVDHVTPISISAKEDIDIFLRALIRHQQQRGLYSVGIEPITYWGDTLFRTVLNFPKNIPGGTYTVEVYLFNDGQLIAMQSTPISVNKIGFEAFVFDLAYTHSWLYGMIAVFLAIGAGAGASILFRRFA